MKKFLSLFLVLTTFIVSCGSDTLSDVENDTVSINTVSMFGGENQSAKYYQDIIQEYEQRYGIIVNDVSEGSSEYWKSSVRTDFQVGNEPDVIFYFTGSEVEPLIESEQFVDIATIRAEYPEYGSNISKQAMSFMIEPDGLTYALPVRGFWEGLIINTDLFSEYNLELPTTWESFITAIEAFNATDIIPIAVSLSDEPHYLIEHLILAYGGIEGHSQNLIPGEPAPDSWINGLNLLVDLNNLGAFGSDASTITSSEAKQLFKDKKAAMIIEGSWFSGGIPDQKNTTVISFPSYITNKKLDTDIIGGFSSGFYITKKAWNDPIKRDASVKFVEMMTSDESIEKFANAGGAPAASIEASADLSPVQNAGISLVSNATTIEMPIDSRINKLSWEYILANITSIVEGTTDARTVLDTAANLNN